MKKLCIILALLFMGSAAWSQNTPAPADLQVAQKQLKTKDVKQDKGNVKVEKGKDASITTPKGKEVKEAKSSGSKTKAKDQGKKQK